MRKRNPADEIIQKNYLPVMQQVVWLRGGKDAAPTNGTRQGFAVRLQGVQSEFLKHAGHARASSEISQLQKRQNSECLNGLYDWRSHFGEDSESADAFYFRKSAQFGVCHGCSASKALVYDVKFFCNWGRWNRYFFRLFRHF